MMITSKRLLSTVKRPFPLNVSGEIRQALNDNVPVVSLESTIITHGLPFPQNLEMATKVEKLIRDNGAIPATCAFIGGKPYVGLNDGQLSKLAELKLANKVSRRDIGYTIANKLDGGTTIALTMILSHQAGIQVFATGGLGGVHRDGQFTMDISADLTELGRTPVAVVCAGPKSILDIELTMEYLETQGVFVATYNDDNRSAVEVPGFYCRESGVKSPYTFSSFQQAASIIHNSSFLDSGSLFCIPPPKDIALSSDYISSIIDNANAEAKARGIKGKQMTPFLLSKIAKDTNGRSVKCNIDFVMNNAYSATQIAKELCQLNVSKTGFQPTTRISKDTKDTKSVETLKKDVIDQNIDSVIVGSVALDTTCAFNSEGKMHDSNPGQMKSSVGGVGFNIALAYDYSSKGTSKLVSAIGNDFAGKTVLNELEEKGFNTSGLIRRGNDRTAQYISMHNPDGSLTISCADMAIMEEDIAEEVTTQIAKMKPKQLILDCNLSPAVLNKITTYIRSHMNQVNVIMEPTSYKKAERIAEMELSTFPNNIINLITPTEAELEAIYESFYNKGYFEDIDNWFSLMDGFGINSAFRDKLSRNKVFKQLLENGSLQQSFKLIGYFQNILLKLGDRGVVLISITLNANDYKSIPTVSPYKPKYSIVSLGKQVDDSQLGLVIQYFPIPPENEAILIKNVTGAGDTFLGYLSSKLIENDWLKPNLQSVEQEWNKWESIYGAQLASGLTLQSDDAVSTEIKTMKVKST